MISYCFCLRIIPYIYRVNRGHTTARLFRALTGLDFRPLSDQLCKLDTWIFWSQMFTTFGHSSRHSFHIQNRVSTRFWRQFEYVYKGVDLLPLEVGICYESSALIGQIHWSALRLHDHVLGCLLKDRAFYVELVPQTSIQPIFTHNSSSPIETLT